MSLSRRLANLGKAIDSATTGHFLSKGDSDGLFETIQYTDLTGRPTVLDSANITAIVDSAYIQLRQTTSGGSGGLDSAAITNLVDSAYVSARSPAAASGFAAYEYNTSAAQTTFQDSDVNGNVLSYSANGIIVYYNGVLMPTSDYTATDGSSVVFTTAVDSGGTVTIAKWALASSGGSSSSGVWYGDRGLASGGFTGNVAGVNNIDYWDMTTSGNGTDFGDLINAVRIGGSGQSDGSRGLFLGGLSSSTSYNTISYVTTSTPSNATDFGDMTTSNIGTMGVSDGIYSVRGGGSLNSVWENTIDYVTIQTTGNASDFGDLTSTRRDGAPISNSTYGIFAGGTIDGSFTAVIDYVTIATPANAQDFGDLTQNQGNVPGSASDATRGVLAGGQNGSGYTNVIQYITTTSPGNASDFGDLTNSPDFMGGCGNGTVAHFTGGDVGGSGGRQSLIQQVTIQTTSNATSFGNLTYAAAQQANLSGSPS